MLLNQKEVQEIFRNHLISDNLVFSLESLFANKRKFEGIKYDPYYQRNYVWDDDKASYFIESIIIGTEIPPLVFFFNGKTTEVIDGRQRFETINRFLKDDFKLTKKGNEPPP